jgi:hypothetical protein
LESEAGAIRPSPCTVTDNAAVEPVLGRPVERTGPTVLLSYVVCRWSGPRGSIELRFTRERSVAAGWFSDPQAERLAIAGADRAIGLDRPLFLGDGYGTSVVFEAQSVVAILEFRGTDGTTDAHRLLIAIGGTVAGHLSPG